MKRKLIGSGAAVLAAALTLAACSSEPEATPTSDEETSATSEDVTEDGAKPFGDTVQIGIKFDQPGLGLKDGADFVGFDVDVARYVATELGYAEDEIEFIESISAQRETLLENGTVDMVFATYSITDARMERITFGGPYFIAGQDLLVAADDTEIAGPEDLEGRILCSVEGSISAERVRDDFAETVQLYPAQTYSECVELLSSGAIDAVSTDDIILAGFAAQDQYAGQFKVVGTPFSEEKYGVGLEKGSAACEAVNDAITKMFDDGSWEAAIAANTPETYVFNAELNPPEFVGCS